MLHFFHITAQTNVTDTGSFLEQIGGLLALVCALSVLWVGLMAVIIRREGERRRRVREGLPPQAGLHVQAYRWLTGQPSDSAPLSPSGGASQNNPARTIPAPDLAMFTDDFFERDNPADRGVAAAPAPPFTAEPPPPVRLPDDAAPAVSMAPGRMFRDMTRVAMGHKPEAPEQAPTRSIPEQIEALLQQRLAVTPAFSQRHIHVIPAPGGGVRIEVDGTFYDGVGDVADDDVRALLIDVVRTWENNQ